MSEYIETVEWNWQGEAEGLRETRVPVPPCPALFPDGLSWERTLASVVWSRRLTACVVARPYLVTLVLQRNLSRND
jgi:hypothetical protein